VMELGVAGVGHAPQHKVKKKKKTIKIIRGFFWPFGPYPYQNLPPSHDESTLFLSDFFVKFI
jgi:hypothetical protein